MKDNYYLVSEEQLRWILRDHLVMDALKEWYIKKNWSHYYNLESVKSVYYDAIDEYFVDPRDESGDYEAAINEQVERNMRLFQKAPSVKLP